MNNKWSVRRCNHVTFLRHIIVAGGDDGELVQVASTTTGWTDIRSRMNGLCLDVPWSGFWNGNQLWMWGCSDNNNAQTFTTPTTTVWSPIMIGGKCLDVSGKSQDYGAPIVVHDCHWGANQMWFIDSLGRLRPMHAWWMCADIAWGDARRKYLALGVPRRSKPAMGIR